ncbi:MAG: polysaccharide pyruvyl transferase CsaB [Clostridiales Family XIII bacterium]|nr:polysaccharide pyruvyl transferase CsaB [Clostridiales Family XIII bacterium]
MSRAYRILLSGYYGAGNIGDESILTVVVENLRARLSGVEITVLSQSPEATAAKHAVRSVNRRSPAVIGEVRRCDLLISGGGSLLQDVTSRRSILYYLAVMWLAFFFRKEVFIYSQGIGPIVSKRNRRLTAWTLRRAAGIVVRDEASAELLSEIGVNREKVIVTADPVLRIRKAELAAGRAILEGEGFDVNGPGPAVGFAVRERRTTGDFADELCLSIRRLRDEAGARVLLIPFHHAEDLPVIEELERRLAGEVLALKRKYLTDEMLSIIGNMDLLVGVRLHALIYAAVMGVPMIAVSYDPKIHSFMHSLGMKAMSAVEDFKSEYFMEEFEKTFRDSDAVRRNIGERLALLIEKLDTNEEMIGALMARKRGGAAPPPGGHPCTTDL